MREELERCGCGNPRPCVLHDVTDDMREANAALRRLAPEQRGRILCWFCNACRGEIKPTPHRCAEGDVDARERAEEIRDAVAEEREACARVVEATEPVESEHDHHEADPAETLRNAAAAIRARGTPT